MDTPQSKIVVLTFGCLLLLAACGQASETATSAPTTTEPSAVATSEDVSEPVSSTTEPPPGVVADIPCPENASCAAEFFLNGRVYSQGCNGVREDAILFDEVLGSGEALFENFEVFALEAHPEHDVVAISIESGCTEDPNEMISPWTFASVEGAGVAGAACELGVLSEEQRIANNC